MPVTINKNCSFCFARAWRAGFFGAKVLLWADGKKRLRLMSLWCQRQLSAKFLRFLKKLSLLGRVQNFDIPQPFSAEISRKNGALPFTCNEDSRKAATRARRRGGCGIRDFIDTSLIFLPFSPSGAVTVLLEKFPIAKRSRSPKLGKCIKVMYH